MQPGPVCLVTETAKKGARAAPSLPACLFLHYYHQMRCCAESMAMSSATHKSQLGTGPGKALTVSSPLIGFGFHSIQYIVRVSKDHCFLHHLDHGRGGCFQACWVPLSTWQPHTVWRALGLEPMSA